MSPYLHCILRDSHDEDARWLMIPRSVAADTVTVFQGAYCGLSMRGKVYEECIKEIPKK
jgi:hypothetical protein